jgi:hypothetical protein
MQDKLRSIQMGSPGDLSRCLPNKKGPRPIPAAFAVMLDLKRLLAEEALPVALFL